MKRLISSLVSTHTFDHALHMAVYAEITCVVKGTHCVYWNKYTHTCVHVQTVCRPIMLQISGLFSCMYILVISKLFNEPTQSLDSVVANPFCPQ